MKIPLERKNKYNKDYSSPVMEKIQNTNKCLMAKCKREKVRELIRKATGRLRVELTLGIVPFGISTAITNLPISREEALEMVCSIDVSSHTKPEHG